MSPSPQPDLDQVSHWRSAEEVAVKTPKQRMDDLIRFEATGILYNIMGRLDEGKSQYTHIHKRHGKLATEAQRVLATVLELSMEEGLEGRVTYDEQASQAAHKENSKYWLGIRLPDKKRFMVFSLSNDPDLASFSDSAAAN